MRVSGCGYISDSLNDVIKISRISAEVSHNHPEGIKGAEATAVAILMARLGYNKENIIEYMQKNYYNLNFTLDMVRPEYDFDISCQGTVPYSLVAFYESINFEDAIRNAISLGGDSDTLAAITGSIAEAYFGIPKEIRETALTYLDERLTKILLKFETKYPPKIC